MTRRIDVGDRAGEYVLEAKLGEGSFGEVFRARHRTLTDLVVAIKVPRDPRAAARLRDEGILARRVDADAAVKLVGLDLEHDPPYLAFQYVDGESLRQVLRRGPLPQRKALAVARRIFSALRAAHEAKVMHRDVKPENVLLDRNGTAWLADFGLAAAFEASDSVDLASSLGSGRTAHVVGTLRYLSPEQKDPARRIDHRSDLYSAGLVLFEVLTGSLPEGGEVPSQLVPGIDKGWDEVFVRCYARLERRYANAADVIADLDRISARLAAPVRLQAAIAARSEAPKPEIPCRPGVVAGARDPRLLCDSRSPEGQPNLIGWDESRAILRVSDTELQRLVDQGFVARVAHEGRLLFRRQDVVELKSRVRRVPTAVGLQLVVAQRRPSGRVPSAAAAAIAPPAPPPWAWARAEQALKPAGPLVRSVAFGVDALTIAALTLVFGVELFAGPAEAVGTMLRDPYLANRLTPGQGLFDASSFLCIAFLYFSVLTGLLGRTFGKWLFGLKVVEPDGRPLGLGRSAARALGYVVSATPLGLGFLGVAVHPECRGFHDLIADSMVVHE